MRSVRFVMGLPEWRFVCLPARGWAARMMAMIVRLMFVCLGSVRRLRCRMLPRVPMMVMSVRRMFVRGGCVCIRR